MNALKLLGNGEIAQGIVELAGNGDIANPVPILQQQLIGSAKNFYPDKVRGFVFGKRSLIGNVVVDLWEGPTDRYVPPAAPVQMSVASSSASDTAAGTGVRQIMIHYLDASYKPQIALVTLNGLTPVLTTETDILRINGVHSIAVGSAGSPVGNISIAAGGVTYAYMVAGFNTARQAFYTVPDGYWGYINHWQQSSGSTGNHFCQTILQATTHDGAQWPGIFLIQDEAGSQNGGCSIDFPIPIPIPPRTDVKISAVADAANANVIALGAIMGWFEPV
jgi:hypothetical protein